MGKQAYLGRSGGNGGTASTIRAAGRLGPATRVDLADMEWGAGLAGIVTTTMMEKSANCLVQTLRGEFADRLIRMIQRHGSISRRDLQRFVRGRYRTQDLNDILAQAIEAGLILKTGERICGGQVVTAHSECSCPRSLSQCRRSSVLSALVRLWDSVGQTC